jgi:hypothetical protein
MTRTFRWAFLAPILLVPLVAGCGSKNPAIAAKVSGKVTYNGSSVTAGNVIFYTEEGQKIVMPIGPDGMYRQSDIPAGKMLVEVETESANKGPQAEYTGGRGPGAGKKAGMSPIPEDFKSKQGGAYVKIPGKYASKDTSGLSTTLSKGSNTYDIPLAD